MMVLAGGGGGYYGGQASNTSKASSGAGGSGYVSGHAGCIAIKAEDDITPKVNTYSNIEDSYHYSGKVFKNTQLTTGISTTSKASITALSFRDEYLISNITVSNGFMTRAFNPAEKDYYIDLDSETTSSTITVTTTSDDIMVENGLIQTYEFSPGETICKIKAKTEDGFEEIYTLHFVRKPSSDSRLKMIILGENEIAGYNENTTRYEIVMPYDVEETLIIDAIKKFPNQTVVGLETIDVSASTTIHTIEVTAEDGQSTTTYTLILNKQPNTKLKFLDFKNQEFAPIFKSDQYNYEFVVTSGVISLDTIAIPYDDNAKVVVKGAGYIKEGKNIVTITVSRDGVEDTIYTVNIIKGENLGEQEFDFPYTGEYQTFIAPVTGFYKLEAWGARGGYSRLNGSLGGYPGKGGYTAGTIKLYEGDTIYVYVGGKGSDAVVKRDSPGGWNGGGLGTWDNRDDESSGGGGGATDFRLVSGAWNNTESLYSRIMVAGAGGGASWSCGSGSGGGLNGYSTSASVGGTQTSGYGLGIGKDAWGTANSDGVGGGASGYYGGMTNNASNASSGAGGSSYISGHEGCISIDENGNPVDTPIHYSTWKFKNTVMIDGNGYEWMTERGSYVQMPSPQGTYVTGNLNDGYARITLLEDPSQNNLLKEVQIDKGTMTPELNYEDTEYTINVGTEDTKLTIYGVVDDIKSTIEGNGTYDIKAGENIIELKVTAESGDERTYTFKVIRQASSTSKPLNITIEGLIENIINVNPIYGVLDPEAFDPDIHEYSMIVPSRIKKLIFEVEKGHEYQTVEGDGTRLLAAGENRIVITVTSEDGTITEEYVYNITRDMSGNCLLELLEITNVETDLDFDQDVLEYFVEVENEVTYLDILAIPEMKEITPIIEGNTNLKVGLNDIYIIVTAPNGEQLVYIIHAYRKQSGNVFLSSLKVKNGTEELPLDPTYNKILDTYIVTVPNEIEQVLIEAIPEASTSTVSGAGTKVLKTGTNTYKIVVTAEDGSKGTYTININRAQSSNNYLKKLLCSLGNFDKSFDKITSEYEITVPSNVTSLPLIIETEDKSATYKVLQNGNFVTGSNIVIIRVTAEDGSQRDYKIKVTKEPSENNYLLGIITNHGTLNPRFNKETTEYRIEVENEIQNIQITAIKEDLASRVTGEGIYALEVGENEINLFVTAENGDTRNYKIIVTRKLNSNKNLLRIDNSEDLSATKVNDNTYRISARNEIEELIITGIPEVRTSTVTGNGKVPLVVGDNIVILTVQAEDGTTKDYNIIINRAKSNNNYLKQLFAYEGELYTKFEKTISNYRVNVLEEVTQLTLDIEPEDPDATYEVIGNNDFVIGENEVIVRVTASDGLSKRDYVLTVYRQPDIEDKCDLTTLSVNKGTLTPAFDPKIIVYDVSLPYEQTNITVSATSLDNTATVTGTGTYNLNVGLNVITVKVTSQLGEEKVYQVRVTRAKSKNANLATLQIQNHNLTPTFAPNTTLYALSTQFNNLNIYPTTEEPDATYEIIGNENFEKGANEVIIRVTAPDGVTTKDYTLKILKTGSDNNNLEYLAVNGYALDPEFNKSRLLYNVYVPNNVNSAYIDAVADDPNATITGIGMVNLQDGINTFEVIVTSETGANKVYTVVITKGLSDNAYLASLTTSQGEFTEPFNKSLNEYELEVEYEIDALTLLGYPEDSSAKVTGTGVHNLKVGENKIEIVVTSASGRKNTYTVTVTRKPAVSAKLSKLQVRGYPFTTEFNPDVNDYFVSVDNEITSLDLIIETLDPKATYVVIGNSDLVVGNNEVQIEVTSSDGITKEIYTINVNRKMSSNNYLSYILPSKGILSPSFVKTTINYTVIVPNEITQITIDADTEDSNATLTGTGDYNLNVGENKITLEVTSIIGIKRTYTVTVIREKSKNNYLKSLNAKIGSENQQISPIFNKEIHSYTIEVPVGTTRIQLLGEAEHELATVTGFGYVPLVAGENKHQIQVKAEDGSIRTYEITINRQASNINDLTDIIPSVGTLDPSFTYGRLEYDLVLGNNDSLLSFEVNTQDRFATVTGNEEQEVPDGESVREISVRAEDGTEKIYKINIIRIRTDDARLKSLAVKSYTIDQEFDPDVYEYTLTVPNDKFILTENEIVAVPIYEDTKVFPDVLVELSVLKLNKYQIKTLAADGYTSQTYTIYVTRKKSSDSTLSKLAVAGYELTPEFSKEVTQYTLVLPKGTPSLKAEDVIAVPTDEYATVVKGDDLNLNRGERTFNIDVTSHDGTSYTNYKIIVDRAKSDNNYLESLTTSVGTLSPTFDTNVVEYTLHMTSRQDTVTINAIPQDECAKVISGNGTYTITEATKRILVMVQAEDLTLRAYIIDITKDPKTETTIEGQILTENTRNKHIADILIYKDDDTLYSKTQTEEDGTYKIYVVPDTYKVVIQKPGYLDLIINNVEIPSLDDEIVFDTYKLLAGDVVQTGEIEIDDLVSLNDNFGITINYKNKKEKSIFDLNEDGIIDKLDRDILKANYGKQTQQINWKEPDSTE